MKSQINESIIPKAEAIINQPMKYSELCRALSISPKTGDSKPAQLNELQCYCNIEIESNPTRYIITEVYDPEFIHSLSSTNKFQRLFDAALYQAVLNNKGQPLYLSSMETLKLFQEVNENFSYACNSEQMARMGEEYLYMSSMSQTVYKILRQWTRRRLEQMADRKIILPSAGFRLYKPHIGSYGIYKTIYNVPMNSSEEKMCQEIWDEAVSDIMPVDWNRSMWVAEWKWRKLEKRISELTKEKFNGEYIDMRSVIIMRFPSNEWLRNKLEQTYREISDFSGITIEACRKIMNTTQLDKNTGEERKKFVEINMGLNPPIKFKEELKKKIKEKEEGR